ncbi:MAG: histidine kinase, partial [Candidatus Dormibacteria bacterium]
MADQLNDDPVQTLAHVTRLLQSVDDLPGASPEATQAVREAGVQVARVGAQLRRLARELRPPLLDDVGLGAALRQLAADFRAETGIP